METSTSVGGERAVELELEESDIPGAVLSEPFESHTVPQLRWWLLCRGINPPTSWKKSQLVSRVAEAKQSGAKVVDVDGSFLYKKGQRLRESGVAVPPIDHPAPPLSGWETVSADNYKEYSDKIPLVTVGTVYVYMSEGVGSMKQHGAFRALTRGFQHWASGRIDRIEVNLRHPEYCHVKCSVKPSMKQGQYHVYVLLKREGEHASVIAASCECAAGLSACCTHVSALLHALTSLCPTSFVHGGEDSNDEGEAAIPITSLACQWKPPRKRKESSAKIADVRFEKHVYGRAKKRDLKQLEDFDPRPQQYRGTASNNLSSLLDSVRGQGLCVSLLLDPRSRHWSEEDSPGSSNLEANIPDRTSLQHTIDEFRRSLQVSEAQARSIAKDTVGQRDSPLWFAARRYRITSSLFGEIKQRKASTAPDKLVMRILNPKQFSSVATDWGIRNEATAIEQYKVHQHSQGHNGLTVCPVGFLISLSHPFLGATPDGAVYDPTTPEEPYGFLEVKCPYSQRNKTPVEACSSSGFCCSYDPSGEGKVTLRDDHRYYCQVQGQMAIGKRPWCDFVIYTTKGISVERIKFDEDFWQHKLLPKLVEFYDKCLAPEIVSPQHALGLPIRDLRQH